MKRTSLLQLFWIGLALTFALQPSSPAFAQGGERPQIALSVSQASPGATIQVEGGRFEHDIMVTLALFQNGTQLQLGTLLADDHGEFTTPVLLPLDLQPGQYEFHAIDEKYRRAIAPLTIVPDDSEQDDNGQREDSDSLLAPMPTFASGAAPSAGAVKAPSAGAVPTPALAASQSNPSKPFSLGLLILLLALSAGAGLWIFRKRKPS